MTAAFFACGFQLVFIYAMALVVLLWYVYKYTPVGRQLYFVGASRDVARLAGLNVVRLKGGDVVLDNLDSALRSWSQATYRWVRMQTPGNPNYWVAVAE